MAILDNIKKSLIRGISGEDVLEAIKKIDEMVAQEGYELILYIQRENGKLETVKIVGFDVVKN